MTALHILIILLVYFTVFHEVERRRCPRRPGGFGWKLGEDETTEDLIGVMENMRCKYIALYVWSSHAFFSLFQLFSLVYLRLFMVQFNFFTLECSVQHVQFRWLSLGCSLQTVLACLV
jgi:hypothetical protein